MKGQVQQEKAPGTALEKQLGTAIESGGERKICRKRKRMNTSLRGRRAGSPQDTKGGRINSKNEK